MTWNSSEMPLPPCMSRARRAISSALPQLLRFIREIAGGAARPASMSRPSRSAPASPSAISVCMSASFFWISWLAASGRPNCLRSSVYCRAACQQNSAAPITPQEIPYRARLRQPKGPDRALHVRQQIGLRHEAIFQHDFAGDARAQRELAFDLGRGKPLHAAFDDEAADD